MNESSVARQNQVGYVTEKPRMALAGREFDPTTDQWILSKDVTLTLRHALCLLDDSLKEPYRAVMANLACNYSAGYCARLQGILIPFLRQTGTNTFTTKALLNYRGGLDRRFEYKVAYVAILLKHWHRLGYPGVRDDVLDLMDSWTLKGAERGAAVKSLDPIQGPLDDLELLEFNEKAAQEFERGRIPLSTLAFALLLSLTGRRPGQLLLIRISDLYSGQTPGGNPAYLVRIPRAKQQGQPPRSETNDYSITSNLYRLLQAQANSVLNRVNSRFDELPEDLPSLLPLFPNWRQLECISDAGTLSLRLRDDSLYETCNAMAQRLDKIIIFSHRTGLFLSIPARRFRYTQGSRAARQGFGEYVIAELLDHSDTQNAKVYTRDHPNFRRKVDEAFGQSLIPVAQAFAGTLVNRDSEAINGTDLDKRVRNGAGTLGACGSQGFCGAIPIACYTCTNFQPFLDAPHRDILKRLQEDRKRVLDNTGDVEVASATDRSILAVKQVISLCDERKTAPKKEIR